MRPEKEGIDATPSANGAKRSGSFLVRNIDIMFVISFPVLFLVFNIVYWFSLM